MRRFLTLVLLLLSCGLLAAQTEDCSSLAQQALELSGFNRDIDQLAEQVKAPNFSEELSTGWNLSPEAVATITRAMQKGFEPQSMKNELQALLAFQCRPDQMGQVIQKLQLPWISRMVSMEAAVKTPQGQQEFRQWALVNSSNIPSLPRMAVLQKMDKGVGASDFAAALLLTASSGVASGLGLRGASNIKLNKYSEWEKAEIGGNTLTVLLFTYRSASDEELRDYTKALIAEPLKGFYAQARQSFLNMIEDRGKIIGEELGKDPNLSIHVPVASRATKSPRPGTIYRPKR
jgi:hypothetical protein